MKTITKYLTFVNIRKFLSLAVVGAAAPEFINIGKHPLAMLGVVLVAWVAWPSQDDFLSIREADQPVERFDNPPEPQNLHWYLDGTDGEISIVDADDNCVYEEADLCAIVGIMTEDGLTAADLRKLLASANLMVEKHNNALS